MDISNSVSLVVHVLTYVLPAAFIWAIAERICDVVIGAATGKRKGL